MEGHLESKRRDTAENVNSTRVGRETAEISHLKIEPVRIQTSPRIETNRRAQRRTPGKCNCAQLDGAKTESVSQPHPLALRTFQSQESVDLSMSSSPSPYNSNAAWSTGHYSRSSPAHPSQQTTGPKSTRGMSAEEEEEESDENNDTAEDAPEQNRLSQLKGLFLKDCTTAATSTRSATDCTFLRTVREIVFGFGDDAPAPDTVSLMEEILIEYLNDVVS